MDNAISLVSLSHATVEIRSDLEDHMSSRESYAYMAVIVGDIPEFAFTGTVPSTHIPKVSIYGILSFKLLLCAPGKSV